MAKWVQKIRDHSAVSQWKHVKASKYPDDFA